MSKPQFLFSEYLAALAREGLGGEALCAETVRAVRREAENEANEAIHDVRAD
jgi:hypothetical protein